MAKSILPRSRFQEEVVIWLGERCERVRLLDNEQGRLLKFLPEQSYFAYWLIAVRSPRSLSLRQTGRSPHRQRPKSVGQLDLYCPIIDSRGRPVSAPCRHCGSRPREKPPGPTQDYSKRARNLTHWRRVFPMRNCLTRRPSFRSARPILFSTSG